MATQEVKTIKLAGYNQRHVYQGTTATIVTTPWYERPIVIIAIITGLSGVAGVIYQFYPDFAIAAVAISVLNTVLTTYETVVNSKDVVVTVK